MVKSMKIKIIEEDPREPTWSNLCLAVCVKKRSTLVFFGFRAYMSKILLEMSVEFLFHHGYEFMNFVLKKWLE